MKPTCIAAKNMYDCNFHPWGIHQLFKIQVFINNLVKLVTLSFFIAANATNKFYEYFLHLSPHK